MNRNLENVWKGKGIKFINNNNIDSSKLLEANYYT